LNFLKQETTYRHNRVPKFRHFSFKHYKKERLAMRKLSVICIILFLVCRPGFAHAKDVDMSLLIILRDNGTITQQQFDTLAQAVSENQNEQEDAGTDVKIKTKGGLEISTYDGKFSFELGGRLMIDAAFYGEDKNVLGDGTELRRARLDVEGILFADWGYEFAVDFAGGDADVKDAYISYLGLWPTRIKVGQFKEPFSLEEMTSSKYITLWSGPFLTSSHPAVPSVSVSIRPGGTCVLRPGSLARILTRM